MDVCYVKMKKIEKIENLYELVDLISEGIKKIFICLFLTKKSFFFFILNRWKCKLDLIKKNINVEFN